MLGELGLFVLAFAKIGKLGTLGRAGEDVGDIGQVSKIAEKLSKGHAFEKHVLKRGEFPGITSQEQFARLVDDVITNGEKIDLPRDRSAYWKDGTTVIVDPKNPDGG
ncbi:hypothetical protein ACXR2T_09375 [Leucobacter sp. HY1910]